MKPAETSGAKPKDKDAPKFRENLLLNLLDREIGSQQRKYTSKKDTYCHPYQLLASSKPNHVHDFALNDCEPPQPPGSVQFDMLADCLGFSPDGKYLAFHSHGRTAISVLKYSGVEGGMGQEKNPPISSYFSSKQTFSLTEILAAWNYDNGSVYGSWWTDDSTTIVVQLKVEAMDRDDFMRMILGDLEGVNDAFSDERAQWDNPDAPIPMEAEVEVGIGPEGQEVPLQAPNFAPIVQLPPAEPMELGELEELQELAEIEEDEQLNVSADWEAWNLRTSPMDPIEPLESGNPETPKPRKSVIQYGETSRTVPYFLAMESASEVLRDSRRFGETSRTMSVFHALTSSMDPQNAENVVQDVQDSEELKKLKIESGNLNPNPNQPKTSNLQKWITRSRGLEFPPDRDPLTNSSCLGYSSPASILRRNRIEDHANNFRSSGSYADRLRDAIEEQRLLEPNMRHLPYIEDADGETYSRINFVFLAYNVIDGSVAPLMIESIFRKFEVHMRDRTLTVAYRHDLIDTYNLHDQEIRWSRGPRYRMTNLTMAACKQYYFPGTVPGMASKFSEEGVEKSCADLFNFYEFNSPVQQSAKALLYRDMKDWYEENETLRTERPELTRCHMIADNLLAITITFYCHPSRKPIHQGALINLVDQSFKLYPDYVKFLQFLFTDHLADLLPRHWTYLNPLPVMHQNWFKESLIDVSKPEQMSNYARLKSTYDIFYQNWCNVKSASNPFSDEQFFSGTTAVNYLTKYAYDGPNGSGFSGIRTHRSQGFFHVEKYYHPTDPLVLWHHLSRWFIAIPMVDPADVIVKENEPEEGPIP